MLHQNASFRVSPLGSKGLPCRAIGRHFIAILTKSPQLSCSECRTLHGVCWFVVCVDGVFVGWSYTACTPELPVKTSGAIGRHFITPYSNFD